MKMHIIGQCQQYFHFSHFKFYTVVIGEMYPSQLKGKKKKAEKISSNALYNSKYFAKFNKLIRHIIS